MMNGLGLRDMCIFLYSMVCRLEVVSFTSIMLKMACYTCIWAAKTFIFYM
jgi:hypothetical protein